MAHLWTNDSGVHYSAKLSKFLRYSAQPLLRFRQFTEAKDAFGKEPGDTFNFDKVANVSTIGGTLVETNTMNKSNQSITKGTLTITEYGNSLEFTFKIDKLSQFELQNIISKGLRDDMVKVLDAGAHAQFDTTPLYYVGTATDGHALTTDGTATATNTSVLNERHVRKMALELDKRNGFAIGEKVFVGSLEAVDSLQGAMVSINQYQEAGYKKILEGEQGVLHGVRIVSDNNATRLTYDLDARTTSAKTWTKGESGEGFMFVGMPVIEAVSVPEQIRAKEVTDYGRSKGLAWYFLGGWVIERSEASDSRIIKWASAA